MRSGLPLLLLLLSATGIRADEGVLSDLRAAARGEAIAGLHERVADALRADPRRARADLPAHAFRWELSDYAPLARGADARAVAALALWISVHGDTIAAPPARTEYWRGGTVMIWPGSALYLEDDAVSAAGASFAQIRALGSPPAGRPPRATASPRAVAIAFTNDLHGALLPYRGTGRDAGASYGGLASVATYLRRARIVAAAQGRPLFVFDAGDFYQGTPEGTLSRGAAVVPILNELRYDAVAIGNHEYDHGRENAEALARALAMPVLGANVIDEATGAVEDRLVASTVLRRGGVTLALTGVLSTEMPTLTFASNIRGLAFRDETETIRAEAVRLARERPDLVVGLNHAGVEHDKSMAASVPELDLIVGGHSHTYLREAWVDSGSGVIVVQAGSHGQSLGRIDLVLRPGGGVDTFAYRFVPLYDDRIPPDADVLEKIRAASADVTREVERVVGTAEAGIASGYREESELGRLATDVLRAWAGSEIAILHGGGIRAALPAGQIRVRDCFRVFPFGNRAARGRVRGDVLLRTLEHGATTDRGRIQVSGIEMEIDTALAPGARLISVKVNGAPLEANREYDVATDAFLAQGGSGYFARSFGSIAWTISDEEVMALLIAHFERAGNVSAPPTPRLRYRD